jgi:multicomponent Na+:H+ antiporter subunit F
LAHQLLISDTMINAVYLALSLLLLVSLAIGLWRVRRGPTAADRMLVAQLFGTTAVAVLLLLAEGLALPALHDVALVLALLAALAVVAFTRRVHARRASPED